MPHSLRDSCSSFLLTYVSISNSKLLRETKYVFKLSSIASTNLEYDYLDLAAITWALYEEPVLFYLLLHVLSAVEPSSSPPIFLRYSGIRGRTMAFYSTSEQALRLLEMSTPTQIFVIYYTHYDFFLLSNLHYRFYRNNHGADCRP